MRIMRALAFIASAWLIAHSRACSRHLEPAARRDHYHREPAGHHYQPALVQHLDGRARRRLDRAAAARNGYAVVHRSRCRDRWRVGQLARCRQAAVQCRFHRDDGQAAGRYLLERRRRVHRRRCRLYGPDADQEPQHDLGASLRGERRYGDGAGQAHRGLQAEAAQLPLPRDVHGALERGLDHAEARVRKGRGPDQVRLQPAGHDRPLQASQLRPERQMVHMAEARRLAAHFACPLW